MFVTTCVRRLACGAAPLRRIHGGAGALLSNPSKLELLKAADEKRGTENSQLIFEGMQPGAGPDAVVAGADASVEQQAMREFQQQCFNKEAFHDALHVYLQRYGATRRGHVEFIESALKQLPRYNCQRDLDTYRRLVDIFPKGKMVTRSRLAAEFYHYPKQQACAMLLMNKMDDHGVVPDEEFGRQLIAVFGENSYAYARFLRMMYWHPKRRWENPWPVLGAVAACPLTDGRLLARLLLRRLCRDPLTQLTLLHAPDTLHRLGQPADSDAHFAAGAGGRLAAAGLPRNLAEDAVQEAGTTRVLVQPDEPALGRAGGWICSAQAPAQTRLLAAHDTTQPLYVDGPLAAWYGSRRLGHFVLSADPDNVALAAAAAERQRRQEVEARQRSAVFDSAGGAWWADWWTPGMASAPPPLVPKLGLHQQADATVLALCVMGPDCGAEGLTVGVAPDGGADSDADSDAPLPRELVMAWLRGLQQTSPDVHDVIARSKVVFRLKGGQRVTLPANSELKYGVKEV